MRGLRREIVSVGPGRQLAWLGLLALTMALAGCRSVSEIGRDCLELVP